MTESVNAPGTWRGPAVPGPAARATGTEHRATLGPEECFHHLTSNYCSCYLT